MEIAVEVSNKDRAPATYLLPLLAFSLIVLFASAIPLYHFRGRDYRQDEAWHVYYATTRTVPDTIQLLASANIHPPAWQILLHGWIAAVGQTESATRYLSSLLILLSLAVIYRLALDLFDAQTGLFTLFLLATSAFVQFFGHEVRPYSALLLTTTGASWFLLRWLRSGYYRYAVLYVGLGIALLYVHFFGFYVIAAHALFLVGYVRWNRARYLWAFGLFAAIGLSTTGWLLPFLHSVLVYYPGGIHYSINTDVESLVLLHEQMQFRPYALGQLLLLTGLLLPTWKLSSQEKWAVDDEEIFRFKHWRKGFLVALSLGILGMAAFVNLFVASLTPRNLITIVPSLAILAGFALRAFRWQVQVIACALILVPAFTTFPVFVANGPYRDLVALIDEHHKTDSPIFIEADLVWQHVPITYYLVERSNASVRPEHVMHLISESEQRYLQSLGESGDQVVTEADNDIQARVKTFLGDAAQVWLVQASRTEVGDAVRAHLETGYILHRMADLDADGRSNPHTVYEYRRIPPPQTPGVVFGDQLVLTAWHILDDLDVQPCQTIRFESWWTAVKAPEANYSLSFTLAAGDFALAQSDSLLAGAFTQQWVPAEFHLDERALTIPCDAVPGEYPLIVVVYDYLSKTRLQVGDADYLYLTTARIAARDE